jgi:hypothetical protein
VQAVVDLYNPEAATLYLTARRRATLPAGVTHLRLAGPSERPTFVVPIQPTVTGTDYVWTGAAMAAAPLGRRPYDWQIMTEEVA